MNDKTKRSNRRGFRVLVWGLGLGQREETGIEVSAVVIAIAIVTTNGVGATP